MNFLSSALDQWEEVTECVEWILIAAGLTVIPAAGATVFGLPGGLITTLAIFAALAPEYYDSDDSVDERIAAVGLACVPFAGVGLGVDSGALFFGSIIGLWVLFTLSMLSERYLQTPEVAA